MADVPDIYDGEGWHNLCVECDIDYPMFTKFCLRCGRKLS